MEKLIATGLPIIEDCCTTFFSQDALGKIGKYGDFSVYSLPKFFPIQIGGILVSNTKKLENPKSILNKKQTQYLQNVVSNQLKSEAKLLAKRNENWNYALSLFSKLGFSERFSTTEKIVPSAMLLNNNTIVKDLATLKTVLANNGIQSSVFYGEDAFFLPNHQNLSPSDMDYFYSCILEFLKIQ
jgi:dTDP-4-amino-4,6-dideoxygalactose transaminase